MGKSERGAGWVLLGLVPLLGLSAESLAAYPPGVPNVLPGERLTAPTLAYIADSLAHGGLVRGASDRSLATIRVVKETPPSSSPTSAGPRGESDGSVP